MRLYQEEGEYVFLNLFYWLIKLQNNFLKQLIQILEHKKFKYKRECNKEWHQDFYNASIIPKSSFNCNHHNFSEIVSLSWNSNCNHTSHIEHAITQDV